MNKLRVIYGLLREEYALSRHIWWLDEASGKVVNDVVHTVWLIHKAAEGVRRGEEACWRELVEYAIGRSMSYPLIHAIGDYLRNDGELHPLPLMDLTPEKHAGWKGGDVPLLDETERLYIHAMTDSVEPDRRMAFKSDHHWTRYKPRMRDEHPAPEAIQTTSKSIHWLFA